MTEKVTTQLKEVYDKGRTAKNLIPQGRIPDLVWNTDQQGKEKTVLFRFGPIHFKTYLIYHIN